MQIKRKKKVKIDYNVLMELLSIYNYHDCSMRINYVSQYDSFEREISQKTIKKAQNIINNS